jgi:hypothetical protein
LQVYQTTFLDFKYKPPYFIVVGIGMSSRALATPFVVQLITTSKPISPLRSGIGLEIIPLLVQTFTMLVQVTIVITKLVKGSEKFI